MRKELEMMKLLICLTLVVATYAHAGEPEIPPEHLALITKWLKVSPHYRLATLSDCACNQNIEEIRKGDGGAYKAEPNYLPFYAHGTFNGTPSFAVLVVKASGKFGAKIIVVDESGKSEPIEVAYPFVNDQSLEAVGLFVRHKKSRRDTLLIGAFNSEAEVVNIQVRK